VLTRQLAWIEAEGNLVLTASNGPGDFPWSSAISRLITGINAEFGEERYRFLRRRIHCEGPVSQWDRNLVKVCAKRLTAHQTPPLSDFPGEGTSPSLIFPGEGGRTARIVDLGADLLADPASDRVAAIPPALSEKDALALTGQIAADERRAVKDMRPHLSPRCVVALLVDKDGHVIAANVNTNAGSQMRHAEVNLLLAMASRGINRIPAGATIYTSLKPCRMCASLILSVQEDCSPLRVVTLADDEGRHGKHRMLLALEIVK
jgi:tRNA(Arg) A34 adenosine deaminase TadA